MTVTPTVSAIAVLDLAQELVSRKVLSELQVQDIVPEVLAAADQAQQMQNIEEARLTESLLLELWQAAASQPGTDELGIQIGGTVNEKAKGFLANWISQCDTLEEAFQLFRSNIALLNPSEQWCYEAAPESSLIRFGFRDNAYPVIAVERSMAALMVWSAYLSQREIPVLAAYFTRAQPEDDSHYRQLFGDQLFFSHEHNALVLSETSRHFPIPGASSYLKNLLRAKASTISLHPPQSISRTVKTLLEKDLLCFSQVDTICDTLNMSRSTLYRQLKGEGSAFSDLLDAVRQQTAVELKKSGLKDASIAEMIGFKDTASYYKAKRRWAQSNSYQGG